MGDLTINFNFYDDSDANFSIDQDFLENLEQELQSIECETADYIEEIDYSGDDESYWDGNEYDGDDNEYDGDDDDEYDDNENDDILDFDYEYDESSEEWVYSDDVDVLGDDAIGDFWDY